MASRGSFSETQSHPGTKKEVLREEGKEEDSEWVVSIQTCERRLQPGAVKSGEDRRKSGNVMCLGGTSLRADRFNLQAGDSGLS